MASVLDLVQQHLGPQEVEQIAQQLGVDPATAQQAVNAAIPAMVGGAAATAQQPGGAGAIQQMLGGAGGLGGILGGLGSMMGGAGGGASGGGLGGMLGSVLGGGGDGGLLGGILGRHENTVQDGVQQASGLGSDKVKHLMMILAPIVLAAIAKRAMNHGAAATDPGALGNVLKDDAAQAQQQAAAHSPHMGGILGKILDHVESPQMRNG